MAIDTATKRRAALGVSVWMLPSADGTVDGTDRAILLRAYIPFAVSDVITPLIRIFAVLRESRVFAALRELRVYYS